MSETPDQASTRRRWVTLAELVAVAGVIIAALTLWNSWSERRDADAARQAEQASSTKAKSVVHLVATVAKGGDVLRLADPEHRIDTIDVRFPASLGVPVQEGVADLHIDADWIRKPMLANTDGGADDQQGRLPVLITANWWDADTHRADRAIYDLEWRTAGRRVFGRSFKLEALILRERGGSAKRLDALWHSPS